MTRSRPSLAVVMATRNGARWLEAQLESIAAQSRAPDHMVISDDGSEDGTPDLLARFAERASFPVTVLSGPGSGLADNFWHAAGHTRADLLAWADQDDVWHPAKLEWCEAAQLRSDAVLVSHSAQVVDDQLRATGGSYPAYRSDRVWGPLEGDPWHVPSGFASLFRASLLRDVPFSSRPRSHQTHRAMNHDHVVSLRAFVTGPRVELEARLADYRQHADNAAGDPSVRGLAALRRARSVGHDRYAGQAEMAREQGRFAAALPGARPDAGAYFDALADRVAQRAAVHRRPLGPMARARRLAGAWHRGTYRPPARGGFGLPALARDLASVTLGV